MFERRLFYHIDWPTIVALGALCAIGVTMIYATTHTGANAGLWVKQLYAVAVGVVAFAVCLTIDYRRLADNALVFYVVIVALLVAVLLFGAKGGGARRWIPLPYFALQPSEFAKLCVALHAGQVLRRQPPRQPVDDRPGRRRRDHRRPGPADSQRSPTWAPRSRWS